MKIEKILKVAARGGASDVILKTGSIPRFRFNGALISLSDGKIISDEMMHLWVSHLVPDHLKAKLNSLEDLDFSYNTTDHLRFRVNLFRQRGKFGMILRVVSNHVKTMEELQLASVLQDIPNQQFGLVLVTGATGSGKSTTLASIIEKINRQRAAHIITIEDPIEFLFEEKLSTINQREIGIDTPNFESALRSALRQNPDVVLVGELRDKETTETALMAAETGHLVLSTLHTMDAVETLTRLLAYFPPHQHQSLRIMLAQTLKYVVAQRLVPKVDGKGMVPAMEILVANQLVKDEIETATDFSKLRDTIKSGYESYGMQDFSRSLLDLVKKGLITEKTALRFASNRKDLELAMQGFGD